MFERDEVMDKKLKEAEDLYWNSMKEIIYMEDFRTGEKFFCEEVALDYLQYKSVIFPLPCGGKEPVKLFVNANDILYWACADCEEFVWGDIEDIYKASETKWGIVRWVCKRRNQKPMPEIIADMKKDGSWDEEMEALQNG